MANGATLKKLMTDAREYAKDYNGFLAASLVTEVIAEYEANKRGLTIHAAKAVYPKRAV